MTLKYYTKSVYGNELVYLADARSAMQWNSITGLRTITLSQMNVLSALTGVTFERVFEATS